MYRLTRIPFNVASQRRFAHTSLTSNHPYYGDTDGSQKTIRHLEHDIKLLEYETAFALVTGDKQYFINIMDTEKKRLLADIAAIKKKENNIPYFTDREISNLVTAYNNRFLNLENTKLRQIFLIHQEDISNKVE